MRDTFRLKKSQRQHREARDSVRSESEKIEIYLEATFVRHRHDYEIAILARQFSKWWLDFARNILVVGGLYYSTDKSGSTTLKVFSYINLAALFWYMMAYFNTWSFRPFPFIQNGFWYAFVNFGIWLIMYAVMLGASVAGFVLVFQSLAVISPR